MYKEVATGGAAIMLMACGSAMAQDLKTASSVEQGAPNQDTTPAGDDDIVVTGVRASAKSAQALKQSSLQISDAIVATDIGKLPDNNVAEALSRITGVQITRNRGEGATVTIRGLSNVQSQVNGRSIFTPTSRTVAYGDIPSQLIQSVTVFKTPQADQIEGGIGGIVDTRLRRPFDFTGTQLAGSARIFRGSESDKIDPYANILGSTRFNTGIGEIGVLVGLSYQTFSYRQDLVGVDTFLRRTDIDTNSDGVVNAKDEMYIPSTARREYNYGTRKRPSANVALQWRPATDLEIYAEGFYTGLRGNEHRDLLIAGTGNAGIRAGGTPVGAFTTIPGTIYYQSGNWTNVGVIPSTQGIFTTSDTLQGAGGYKWSRGGLTVSGDLSYTHTRYFTRIPDIILNSVVGNYHLDLSNPFDVQGFDFTKPAGITLLQFNDNRTLDTGHELAARNDFEYHFDASILRSIKAGVRFSNRSSVHQDLSLSTLLPVGSRPSITNYPVLTTSSPSDFFLGSYGTINNFLVPSGKIAEDNLDYARAAFGRASGDPAYNPLRGYDISEKVYSGYVMATFDGSTIDLPLDGNIGVRIVRTDTAVNGFSNRADGGYDPVNVDAGYTRILPSLNVRYKLTPTFFLRAAAARQLTRQEFGSLSPTVQLNYVYNTGTAGNPHLKPLESKQYDLAAEWYPAATTSVQLGAFQRNVENILLTRSAAEVINGTTYIITRPRNATSGIIRGVEVGYQQFFDFLPSILSGLGAQANFSFITNKTTTDTGATAQIFGLSRYSYNAALLYDKGPASFRLAYNWRSSSPDSSGPVEVGGRSFDNYLGDRSQLDASFSYYITPKVAVTLEGTNLLQPLITNFVQLDANTRVRLKGFHDDRRFSIGVRARLF